MVEPTADVPTQAHFTEYKVGAVRRVFPGMRHSFSLPRYVGFVL